jgi:hypothetical protein
LESSKQRDDEIRKMIQQLNDKARGLIDATQSDSHLGMPLDKRVKTLQDLKEDSETLLKETINVLTQEGYQKNRDMISLCFNNMTDLSSRLDSAIRNIKNKAVR